jgi:hypothetical protein
MEIDTDLGFDLTEGEECTFAKSSGITHKEKN